jgi:2-oxoglutarate ferredoxin oxidoreductase subunit alpha
MNKTTTAKLKTGSQMIAEGACRAGCRFFAGYPITPASGIYRGMMELLPRRGDVAISAPDEISALAYCIGASMRGFKSMTATSGPGWALMIETLQYALMTETPIVVAMVQRLGPSTGGATQGAQGDILLSEFCTSGGYTIPIFCPSSATEAFNLTVAAFAWSERLRTPVVILSDKEVCMTSERVDNALLQKVDPVERVQVGGNGHSVVKPYDFVDPAEVPVFIPVGADQKATMTGSAHNKLGELKKNDTETLEVLWHLEKKILAHRNEMAFVEHDKHADAHTLVISYGITARAMKSAVSLARQKGKKVASLKIMTLFPVPELDVIEAARDVQRIVIAEENMSGQYRSVIAPLFKDKEVVGVNKIGSMITPTEIEDAII